VLVAEQLEPVASELGAALGLNEPFRDPGVGAFGLTNAVFALGDCFLEIVSPAQADTAAGRYLQRHGGDGGYMVMFDLEDLEGARRRVENGGIRVAWRIDLPDISGTHLHPADMRGAIVSIDCSRPYGSWRWGGPEWTGRVGQGAVGELSGVTIAVADPHAVGARWGEVLGVPAGAVSPELQLDGGWVRFVAAHTEREEGLVEIALAVPAEVHGERELVSVGGVRLRLSEGA
jgi:hypothetical protein